VVWVEISDTDKVMLEAPVVSSAFCHWLLRYNLTKIQCSFWMAIFFLSFFPSFFDWAGSTKNSRIDVLDSWRFHSERNFGAVDILKIFFFRVRNNVWRGCETKDRNEWLPLSMRDTWEPSLWTPRCWSESLCSLAMGFLIGDEDDVRLAGVARVCSPLRTQAVCYQTPLQTTTPSANAMPNLAQFMRDAFSQCRLTLV